jgi:hypothetical protein
MNELTIFLVAVITAIAAGIIWKYVLGMPFIAGYGLGQKRDNSLKLLFEEHFEMVPNPQREIIHLCGRLNSKLWKQQSWIEWLRKAHNDYQVTARILAGPDDLDLESMEYVRQLLEEEVIEVRIRGEKEEKHWLVVDGDWAHIEEKHEGREIPPGLNVKHLFPGVQKSFYKRFNILWDSSKPITLQNLSKIFQHRIINEGGNRHGIGTTTTIPTSRS